jgi:hypothetical protein
MNGLQTLIGQWTHITSAGDLTLYSNDTIALPSFIITDQTPSIVSLEVFRALGYQPPFTDQPTATTAMEQLAAMGGSSAIPGILAPGTPTAPIDHVPWSAPVAIDPTDTSTLGMVPVPPVPTGVVGFGLSPEAPIVPEPPIVDLVEMDTAPSDPDPLPTHEPMIITPIAAPIQYPTAEDHIGLPHTIALGQLDQLTKLLAQVTPIADGLFTAITTMAIDSIGGHTAPIVPTDPGTRSMPSIARSTKAEGFKWYLMIGPLASLSEEQAIEQQSNLLKAAKFTRTPKLDPPGNDPVVGFGEVWYNPISDSQAARLAWLDGTQLPVHNM